MSTRFADRRDAGRRLAERLRPLEAAHPVVLGLPRGGVPVAAEVAAALGAPLDVIVVRKLGVPWQPELAMGAIGEDGVRVVNPQVLADARVGTDDLAAAEHRERAELDARCRRLRGARPPVPIEGRTVLVVDDGIATGSTARAACQVARRRGAARVVLAVPVAPVGAAATMLADADDVICLDEPREFYAVGQFYADFGQVSDAQVTDLLAGSSASREASIPADGQRLAGTLCVPDRACGVVVFAHGSGSSRHSPRNRSVATALNAAGLATLLFDLLTGEEELDRSNVFDVGLLAGRLRAGTEWVRAQRDLRGLPVGYFGASTGAAAALAAAAADPDIVAVVSRGGRPDLAARHLALVRAPTLLIVGGRDREVLELNRLAQAQLNCPSRLEIVPGATHLFEEPGTLHAVAHLAADWFVHHLAPTAGPVRRG